MWTTTTTTVVVRTLLWCGNSLLIFANSLLNDLALSLNTNSFTFLNNMTKKNYAASSTVIGSQLWITGGCMNEDGKFDDACLQVNLSLANSEI